MRNYNTGVSGKVMASMLAVVVITAGVVALAMNFPGGNNPIPPTPTGLGAQTAAFLNPMRDNVQFYFMCNVGGLPHGLCIMAFDWRRHHVRFNESNRNSSIF